jgi:hypothetical protein
LVAHTPSTTTYDTEQLIAIGYTAGSRAMSNAYRTGDRYADTYARNFQGWYTSARDYLCEGKNFACSYADG